MASEKHPRSSGYDANKTITLTITDECLASLGLPPMKRKKRTPWGFLGLEPPSPAAEQPQPEQAESGKPAERNAPKAWRVNRKLTAEAVREIRERYASGGESSYFLAAEYGVSSTAVLRALRRETWQHVD